MEASQRRPDETTEITVRPRYVTSMHAAGVVLSVVALGVGGLDNPAIGFPIAISILISLDVPSSPKPADEDTLTIIHGSIRSGGIKRGAFIKGLFAIALLYAGLTEFLDVQTVESSFRVLLGTALGVSSMASQLEARAVRNALSRVTESQ